ncbi:MAG: LAGLIDADG family homing endonuclease [Candidatus Liptonbacteria bacterium]|nr:LAGLIDADG family homing endonuclease [Candidatus Liptonbacteria bacterium]
MDNTVGSRRDKNAVIDPVTTEVKNRNRLDYSSYYTPTSLSKRRRNIPEYITGYVDGEGCFTVTFNMKAKALLGWELRPSFSVSQNEDKRQVLDIIKKYFGCGYIRRDYADKTVKFEIRDHNDLLGKVIPHFERFPFLSRKQKDFELFKKICKIIHKGKHLEKDGFIKILDLAYQMNGSGKRKRTKKEIIKFLR